MKMLYLPTCLEYSENLKFLIIKGKVKESFLFRNDLPSITGFNPAINLSDVHAISVSELTIDNTTELSGDKMIVGYVVTFFTSIDKSTTVSWIFNTKDMAMSNFTDVVRAYQFYKHSNDNSKR
jgi:hypothetical protein